MHAVQFAEMIGQLTKTIAWRIFNTARVAGDGVPVIIAGFFPVRILGG